MTAAVPVPADRATPATPGTPVRVGTRASTLARVQSARLRASPWQRRSGLATLSVDLAGPGPVPQVLDEAAAVGEHLLAATSGTAEPPVSPDPPAPPPASDPTGGGHRNR